MSMRSRTWLSKKQRVVRWLNIGNTGILAHQYALFEHPGGAAR